MKHLLAVLLVCGLVFSMTDSFAGRDDPDKSNDPTLTSPNGGESWKTGTTRVIKWVKRSTFSFVKIQLLKSGKHALWVSKKTKNDGKYPWKIPSTIATSSAYKFKVTATTNKKLTDTSNKNFTITKTSGGGGSLRITTPNGGQNWTTGKRYAIKWNKGNAGAYVKIQLLKSGKPYEWISKKTKNDGKHPWKVLASVATGSAYKIKITSTTKKTVTDTSNSNFAISKSGEGASSLRVISPNGGEKWRTLGGNWQSYTVRWLQLGDPDGYVDIHLLKSGKLYPDAIWGSPGKNGKATVNFRHKVCTGNAYKIKIISRSDPTVFDQSDRNFTIINVPGKWGDIDNRGDGERNFINLESHSGWRDDVVMGKSTVIKWTNRCYGGFVKIRLLRERDSDNTGLSEAKHVLWITKKTKNDRRHKWKIPSSIEEGCYKIEVLRTNWPICLYTENEDHTKCGGGYSDYCFNIRRPK